MSQKQDLLIGYAPTRRNVFSREDALKYKVKTLDKIKSFGYQIIDIEDINSEGLLLSDGDINKVVKKFKEKNVDCIFSPHCNFGTENVVAKVAKEVGKPFLLWGPRDEAPLPDGSRLRDSQCGLFATSKILQRLNVPFSYIINSRIDSEVFKRGFNNFTRAANVVKSFGNLKIGQIGVRPGDFWSVICNEGELLEKFNIEIVPFNLIDIVKKVREYVNNPTDSFNETLNFIKENMKVETTEEELRSIVGLKETLKTIAIEQGISAFAIQCWTSLQDMIGVVPCLANALLFDEKIPVACETDICGAVTSVITQAANFDGDSVFFADITVRHPEDDNAELLWHCGPFPFSLKKEGEEAIISKHFILDGNPSGTCNWEIKGGDISIVRFDGINGKYSLFVGHCKGTTGPKNKGTYIWIKVNDWSEWEEKLIYGPYIHHVAGVHGKIAPVLYEAIRYIDGLELDLVDPTEREIKNLLIHKN
ncbi:MAG: L-fucose/L-arabinose isomerase family protein [Actinobacteria bacterium]|nr:L-fucose/L-arabinose isomerase family protein [Actinomycetota bacterium]